MSVMNSSTNKRGCRPITQKDGRRYFMHIYDTPMSGLINHPHIFSTVYVGIVERETKEVEDALYDQAAPYCKSIAKALEEYRSKDFPHQNLMRYFSLPDAPKLEHVIKEKIIGAYLTADTVDGTLFAKLDLDMREDLTVTELDVFLEQIRWQYQDGIGAEFELQDIETEEGVLLCLRLAASDLDFFTEETLKDYLECQEKSEVPLFGA